MSQPLPPDVSGLGGHVSAQLGRYRLLRILGQGGMSDVYLGYDSERGRPVAVKMLFESLMSDPSHLERFENERELSMKMVNPHIVRGFDMGTDPKSGRRYLVLEYVDGPSARARLESQGPFPISDVVHIGMDICKALEYVHKARTIHRDIKPDNILLSPTGEAKLIDFGLAKRHELVGLHSTMFNEGFGTSYYMPFEQGLNAHIVDERSDLFALGATLYHLLTGRVPFPGVNHRDVMRLKESNEFIPASQFNPAIPVVLDAILEKAMQFHPKARFRSASHFLSILQRTGLAGRFPSYADLGLSLRDQQKSPDAPEDPTRVDLLERSSRLRSSRMHKWWFLKLHNKDGKPVLRRGTTEQVVKQLQDGRLKGHVPASRHSKHHFRPLAEFPEFLRYCTPPKVEIAVERAQNWCIRMLVGLGFVAVLTLVAGIWSCLWHSA